MWVRGCKATLAPSSIRENRRTGRSCDWMAICGNQTRLLRKDTQDLLQSDQLSPETARKSLLQCVIFYFGKKRRKLKSFLWVTQTSLQLQWLSGWSLPTSFLYLRLSVPLLILMQDSCEVCGRLCNHDFSSKKKMLSDSFPGSDFRVVFLWGASIQAQYYAMQPMTTHTSITPGTLLIIISSGTKQMQLWSKRKIQHSFWNWHHFTRCLK